MASLAMSVSAAVTAQATIKAQGDLSQTPDYLTITEDDALATNFASPNTGIYSTAGGNDFSVSLYAVDGANKYSPVASKSLEGLQIKFIANAYETAYTMSFSNVSGTEYFLQKGDDAANLIPMTEDYAFTCAVSAEIIFTVVKQAAPAYDYPRDGLTAGNWYTICLPKASSSFVGMELYKVAGYVEGQGLAVDPVEGQMVAGMPYIFLATATEIGVMYTGEAADAQTANYLVGVLADEFVTPAVAYVVANNVLNWAAAGTPVPANRAYLAKEDITTLGAPTISAPGRKFIAPKAMPTELNEVAAGMADGTYMINGQVVLVKGGKMFNVLGL
ncbi:MAG: hypothetical protein MJZ64_04755 [Paludibacteraceae bacterium]|nr:hypothetical protein [Paludibacteraceae bacterium]